MIKNKSIKQKAESLAGVHTKKNIYSYKNKLEKGITLVALVITILFSYDKKIKM